jgi:hypothetical protein
MPGLYGLGSLGETPARPKCREEGFSGDFWAGTLSGRYRVRRTESCGGDNRAMKVQIFDNRGDAYTLNRWWMRGPRHRITRRMVRKAFLSIQAQEPASYYDGALITYWFGWFWRSKGRLRVYKGGGLALRIGCKEFDIVEALTIEQWALGL